jgi:hypothetical protein
MTSLNYCISFLVGVSLMGAPINELVGSPRKVRVCNMGEEAKSKVEGFKARVGEGSPREVEIVGRRVPGFRTQHQVKDI